MLQEATRTSPAFVPAGANSLPDEAKNACVALEVSRWNTLFDQAMQQQAVEALEQGKVLFLPQLSFALTPQEQAYLRPDCVKPGTKSIKYSLSRNALWGMADSERDSPALTGLMKRYAESARGLATALLPGYASTLITGNTSFRPVEVEGREQSKRHDDRRLHVDAFPSQPMQGKRILRVFTNVNPSSRPRMWHVGERFSDVAARFLPHIPAPMPGSSALLQWFRLTKGRRTAYDHYMLNLHDRMKLDDRYQAEVRHTVIPFPAGSTWIVFSDQVSHASLSGQHLLEQTFTLPVAAMDNPDASPLHVLEKMKGKALA
ncbi:MAG: Kdo hydroxylase family protein [Pseudomonadota bacterium]|nr:Kdo hydroxylase family protein [Pseudomonadota bacterium]